MENSKLNSMEMEKAVMRLFQYASATNALFINGKPAIVVDRFKPSLNKSEKADKGGNR